MDDHIKWIGILACAARTRHESILLLLDAGSLCRKLATHYLVNNYINTNANKGVFTYFKHFRNDFP